MSTAIFDHEAAPTSADEGMARDGAASHAYVNSVELVDADVTVYAAWGYQEHVWGDWAVETPSTCVQQGTEKRTCTTCDAVERRPLDVLPHEWEANFTVDKPVTCVEDGLKSNHCKHCGATEICDAHPVGGARVRRLEGRCGGALARVHCLQRQGGCGGS